MKTLLDSWLLGGWSYPALTFLLTTAMKSSAIVLLTGALTLCLRQRPALFRLWAWRACLVALASLLVWPFVPLSLDPWRPQITAGDSAGMQTVVAAATRLHVVQDWPKEAVQEVFLPSPSAGFTLADKPRVPLAPMRTPWLSRVEHGLFLGWWGIAALLLGLRVLRAMCGHHWLRRHAEGVLGGSDCKLVRGLRSPVVTGWRRAQIWLPLEAEEWSATKIRAVCLHEAAHHERSDGAWQWFGWVTACVLWWNPLCWLAVRQMTAEAEQSADESALGHDIAATDYAQVLVEIASGHGMRPPSAGVPMLGRSDIEQRVEAILGDAGLRSRFGKIGRWGIVALGVAAVVAGGMEVRHAGLAQAPPPSNPLTKTEKEWMERSLAMLEAQQARLNCLHLKMTQSWTMAGPQPVSSPQPSVIEAWVDEAARKSRAEYRPRVTPWNAGAAPWLIRNETEATDGQVSWNYEGDEVNEVRFNQDPHNVFFLPWSQCQMPDLIRVLRQMRESGFKNFGFEQNTLQEKDGRVIVERQRGEERSRWEVNMEAGGGIALFRTGFPGRAGSFSSAWEVKQWGRLKDGTSYPAKWSWSYATGRNGDSTSYENEISLLETIPGIPSPLLAPPPKAAAVFVATDGKTEQGEALELRFVNVREGKAVADVAVHYEINDGKRQKTVSSHEGVLRIPLPVEEVKSLRFWGLKAGYVMQLVQWRRYGDPLKLPGVYEVKLYPQGKPIGGMVVDEQGRPVAGVEVRILHRGGAMSWDVFADVHDTGSVVKTDASGRWSMKGYAEDLSGAHIFVEHPDHKRVATDYRTATGQGYESLHDGTSKVVLRDNDLIELSGLVSDDTGKPVAGCSVTIGQDRWGRFDEPNAKTDAQGRYRVRLQEKPTDWVTFEAPGFQPQMQSVTVSAGKTATLNLQLSRSRPMGLKVLDEAGAAVVGARMVANRWQQKRTLWFEVVTDAEGRCEWSGAPMDEVKWDIVGNEHVLRDVPISANDAVQTIVFRPAIRFTGTVVDARSGQHVKSFKVTHGDTRRKDIYWQNESGRSYRDGTFIYEVWWMREEHKLRIEAEGYEPFETALFSPKQQNETLTIKLAPMK